MAFCAVVAVEVGRVSDVRSQIGEALGEALDRGKLDDLLEAILELKKGARGWCPKCNRAVMVEINDAKAVAGALKDLNAEAWGRPSEDKVESEGIQFVRKVVYGGTEDA
jgi:hypothetical protein